jgi:putative heme-binding domain-containing protein
MPVLTHLGAAAPCGLVRFESRAFGPEFQDNLFAALFNMHKVTRHVLTPNGASFTSRDEDFLVSDSLDFHPTDVLEDADGSLLVIDTGGWYKLCCPTSQLHKPDLLGAIYRIRRKGAPRSEDPRGLKLAWTKLSANELARLLDDPRPAVRRRAMQVLAAKGAPAMPSLTALVADSHSVQSRRNAIWTATRIDHPEARALPRKALADHDETVRQVGLHSISLWRDREALPQLLSLLKSDSAHNRRGAAEAIGRIGDRAAVPALLDAAGKKSDRALEHALTYALIEISDAAGTAPGLNSKQALTRRAALVALDQMDGSTLEAETVARELSSTQPVLKETASWIVSRHPEWGETLADYLHNRLASKTLTPGERDELTGHLARFARTRSVQSLLARRLCDPGSSKETRQIVLRAIARSGLKEPPAEWITSMTGTLADKDIEILREAVAAARALSLGKQRPSDLIAALLRLASDGRVPVGVRLGALAAVPGGLTEVPGPLFAFVCSHLGSEEPVLARSLATEVLARAKLTSEQLIALAHSLNGVGPMELDRLVDAFAQSSDEQVGLALLAALNASPASSSLRGETLRPRLAKYPARVKKDLEVLCSRIDVDAIQQRAELEKLLGSLKPGDVRRGQVVFNNPKAACASCHAIGYLGGKIGPDLTHIARIRSERDLLESILFPSASLVRSYEPVSVTLKSGKIHNGLVRTDTPEEIVLTLSATEEVRITRTEIEEMRPSKVSIMPAGLDKLLTPQELADLLAFLRACK